MRGMQSDDEQNDSRERTVTDAPASQVSPLLAEAPWRKHLIELYQDVVAENDEHALHAFFVRYPVLVPTSNVLPHGLEPKAVISKFHVSPDIVPDFTYFSSDSIRRRITFVEVKPGSMRWFGSDIPRVTPHGNLTSTIAQIDELRRYLKHHAGDVVHRLRAFVPRPQEVEFRHVLIGGRSGDAQSTEERRAYIRSLGERDADTQFLTLDSVSNNFVQGHGHPKNVLCEKKPGWRYQELTYPRSSSLYYDPEFFQLTQEQERLLDRFDSQRTGSREFNAMSNYEAMMYWGETMAARVELDYGRRIMKEP